MVPVQYFPAVFPAALLILCLGSFAWGVRSFFGRPTGANSRMGFIVISGAVFAVLHLVAILRATDVPAGLMWLGICGYILSLCLYWWAIRVNRSRPLSAAFSEDLPVHLNNRGPYRFVRHPFYCSYLLSWTAGVLASAQWWLALTVLVMIFVYVKAAEQEEDKFARSSLADRYREYQEETGMLLPNPFKMAGAGRRAARRD
jgi:protein-S-isoprenylcysteine O-methyltransferase Ste14